MGQSDIIHDFQDCLNRSHSYANADWWEKVYRKAWPNFDSMTYCGADGWWQRAGIDRRVHLKSAITLNVDEKVREKDYSDILLERWSDRDKKIPGWVQKNLACDYIAYAFSKSQCCYLLPFLTLRRAWFNNAKQWISLAENNLDGYRIVNAQNNGYVTQSVAVPIEYLMFAIADAMIIRWES